jgi:hypothetical protein
MTWDRLSAQAAIAGAALPALLIQLQQPQLRCERPTLG